VLKFNWIFCDSIQSFFISKHPNKAESNDMDDSEVLSSDFPGLKTSMASMTSTASTTSLASMTSTASFHQKIY
jgi:spore coat protein CotF